MSTTRISTQHGRVIGLGAFALIAIAGCNNKTQGQTTAPASAVSVAAEQDQVNAEQAWAVVMRLVDVQQKQGRITGDELKKAVNFKLTKDKEDSGKYEGYEYYGLHGGAAPGDRNYSIGYLYDSRIGSNSPYHADNKNSPHIRIKFYMPKSGCISVEQMQYDISSVGMKLYEKRDATVISPDYYRFGGGEYTPSRFSEDYYLGKGYVGAVYNDYKPIHQIISLPNGRSKFALVTRPHSRCITEVNIESQG